MLITDRTNSVLQKIYTEFKQYIRTERKSLSFLLVKDKKHPEKENDRLEKCIGSTR